MRRKQNKDLQSLEFQMNLAEYLSEIGTLHNGSWRSKTELLEALARASAEANYDPLTLLRSRKDAFVGELSRVCSAATTSGIVQSASPLQREHVRASMSKGQFCGIPGMLHQGRWTLFRVLHLHPSANVYLQRACHLASDVSW